MPGFKDMIKDFYAKYEPEKYSEEQVAKIESFYGSDYNKAIKDFYAKYEPEKYSEEQVKAVAEFYGLKKKETTESSLEDGSSVMPEQETQKPSESLDSNKYRYDEETNTWKEKDLLEDKLKGSAIKIQSISKSEKQVTDPELVNRLNKQFNKQASTSDVAQVFTGYPGKEKNEYTIIDGKWHRRMPGKSEFSEIKNVGSIQALNREFGQDVGASKYRSAVTDEVGQKKQQEKEQLNVKLNSIDGNLVDLEEEEAVTKLKQLFPDFKFEESGALTDNVKVIAPGGVDEITLPFDNFFSSDDSDVAEQLKSFLNTYSDKDLVEKMAKEQEVRDRQQKSILPTGIDLQTEGKDLTKDIKELDILAEEGLPEKQMPDPYLYTKITKEELDPAQKEMLESYNNAFIKLSLDKKTTASDIAALPKNKSVVKSIETTNRLLEDKMGKYSSDLDEFNTLIESGEIDEETFNAKKAEFEKRREDIKDEVRMSTVGSKALSQAITNNSLIREEQGNFVSGMSRNFVSGLTSIGRITGMTAEEHQQLLDDIVGVGTTKDYIQSANRSDLVQAMFSISESIGVATPALLTGGGSLVTGAGFFTQSFYEMKDELDEVKELNGSDKFLMASAYGLVSAALENFGLGVALNKTRVGNRLTKNVMSRFLKALPKNATPQAIKATLDKTIGEFSSDLITRGLKSAIAEGSTEAAQYLSNIKIKEIYDSAKDKNLFDDSNWAEETWRNFYIGALAGGITSATNTSVEHARKFGIDKLENKQMATLMRELREPSALKEKKNFVNEQLKHGLITQEEAKATIEKYDAIHNALNTLPENIKPKVAKEALSLMAERKKLQSEIEGKEETLVVEQKERIKEINNKLTELGKTKEEDAIQEQTTDEGVLRQEESEVGLQEVEQRDQEQEVVAEEEVTPSEKPASLINRPAKLTEYNGKKFDSPLEGDVYVEGQRIVFEDSSNNRVYDLGGVDDDVDFKGLQGEESRVKVTSEGKISIDNQTWNIQSELPTQGVEYNQAGEVSAVSLKDDNGNTKMFKGQDALEIAYQIELSKYQTEEQINNINELLENDEEFKEAVELSETTEVTEGETVENFEQAKKSIGNKALDILNSWENAIDDERQKRRKGANDITGIVGLATAKKIVQAMKVAVKAGMSIEQAIKKVAKEFKVKETDVVEAFDKIQNKVKETQASKAAKGISKKPTKKTTVNERTALRDQIKYAQKIAREIAKNTKEGQEAVRAHINERLKGLKATFNRTQFERAMKRAMKTRFYDAHDVARLNEYIDKIAKKAENFDKIKSALSLKSKIRKRLKNNQKDTKIAAKKFGAIDPIMVEDIDKYIAIAEKVYNAVKPTVLGAKRQDYKTATELDEVMAYAEAEVARQDEIRKQNLLASDKGQLLLMDGIISEDMSLKEIQDAMKEKSEELDEDFMQEIKDITSDMQDRVKEMEDVSEDISDMANMDLESLSKKELVTLYEYLDNFLVNQTEDGTALFNSIIQGKENAIAAKKSGLKFRLKQSGFFNKMNSIYVLLGNNQESLLDRLLGSTSNARLFKELSGLSEFDIQKYKAQKIVDNILKEYDSKFNKVKGFKETKNIYERGIYAYLSRNSDVDFEARKKNVLDSIENLKNSKDNDLIKIAEKLEKDIERMNVADAKNIDDIKVSKFNKSAVEFWQGKWSEHYGDLKYISSTMYNKDLNEDQNYTPDFYRKLTSETKEGQDFIDSGNFGDISSISTNMPGVLMDAKTPNGIKGMYVDFDFDHNMSSKMESALKSIYADRQAVKVKSFLESKEFSDLFEDNKLNNIVKSIFEDYVNRSMKRPTSNSPFDIVSKIQSIDKTVKSTLNAIGLLGTAQVLGSVTQYAKNTVPIIINTYSNLGKNFRYFDFALNKSEQDFIDNLDYPISIRGKEAITGIYKEMGYEKADTKKIIKKSNKISEGLLQATIGASDRYVARTAWMAYYKSELAKQGIKVGDIDWSTHEVNNKAADYAQSMVDRQQNISDKDKRSVLDKSSLGTIMNIAQPFASFILNAKFRIRNDIRTALSSRSKIQEGDRSKAFLSLAGTIGEIVTFQAVSLAISEMYTSLASFISGDDEEKESDYLKKLRKRAISQTVLDIMSPTPLADQFTAYMFNFLSDTLNPVITKQEDIDNFIEEKQKELYDKHRGELGYIMKYKFSDLKKKELREKYLKDNAFNIDVYRNDSDLINSLGPLGKSAIPVSKIMDFTNSIVMLRTMEYEERMFGNKKYLPDEVKGLIRQRIAFSMAGTISPDMAAIGRRLDRTIKNFGLSRTEYEKYIEAKRYSDLDIEDIYLVKNTSLSPKEIAKYSIRYKGEDKMSTYKDLKSRGKI